MIDYSRKGDNIYLSNLQKGKFTTLLLILITLLLFICITGVNATELSANNGNSINIATNTNGAVNNGTASNTNTTLSIVVTKTNIVDYVKPVSTSSYTTKKKPTKLSQSSIVLASKYVDRYVYTNGKLPNSVKISGYRFSMPEYLYLVSKTIQYKLNKNTSSITVKYNLKDPQNIRGTSIYGTISINKMYSGVKEVISYMNYYKVAPNLIKTSVGSMQYQTIVFVFTKILSRDQLPQTITLSITTPNSLTKSTPKYVRAGTKNPLNNRYTGGSLSKYLKASKNCQSNSYYTKTMAKKITKGCKTKLAKAKAIYYWVRDNIGYSYYYNTKYGAKGAISKRTGNCVDQSHAIVALCRASKIPARYVHGKCKFVSGNWYGHVWTQIKVGKTWYVADASNFELNGFGVVNNWRSDAYKVHGKYNSLRF